MTVENLHLHFQLHPMHAPDPDAAHPRRFLPLRLSCRQGAQLARLGLKARHGSAG